MADQWQNPFSERGKKIERLGLLMQDGDSGIAEIVAAASDAGLAIAFVIGSPPDKEPEEDAQQ